MLVGAAPEPGQQGPNQAPGRLGEKSAATNLCHLLHAVARNDILRGTAKSLAGKDIVFRQPGIISRSCIAALVADKRRRFDKLVVVEMV